VNEKMHDHWQFQVIGTVALVALAGFFVLNFAALVQRQKDDAALISAIKRNDTARALELLNRGADPDSTNNRPQFVSSSRWFSNEARSIIRLRPLRWESGDTALLVLCKPKPECTSNYEYPIENIAILSALLARGATVNTIDREGYSSLAYSVAFGEWTTAAVLAEHGANVNARGYDDQPILTSSVTQPALVQLLLDKGANVEARSESGATPLMVAAEYDEVNSVKLLLAHGARVDAADFFGKTALDYAVENYAGKCTALIKESSTSIRPRSTPCRLRSSPGNTSYIPFDSRSSQRGRTFIHIVAMLSRRTH
jgi:ankyrin repeat protein